MIPLMPSERELQAIWYGGQPPSLVLRALSTIYGCLTSLRRRLYRNGSLRRVRLPVPVIVVGNITAGGTGKTPLVIALVDALRARGWKPGIVSRGYAGSSSTSMLVDATSDASIVGDEARLMFETTGVPVAIGRDRPAAGRLLIDASAVNILVADDGLQHYRLDRDIEICVIDGARRCGNGRLLPAGPLREPVDRLQSIAFRVCNGGVAQTDEIAMTLSGDEALSLVGNDRRNLRDFSRSPVHAIAGIGNPERFFAQLRAAGLDVLEHSFDDHHPFTAHDLEFSDDRPILMTEKDAVKCRAFAQKNCWSVPVHAQLPESFIEKLSSILPIQ